eukprot:jgi/Sobl393_1/18509/SZX73966.1
MHTSLGHITTRLSSTHHNPSPVSPQYTYTTIRRTCGCLARAAAAEAAGQPKQRAKRQHRAAAATPPAELVVGIDLGTTNSAIAYMHDGKPICIPNDLGDTLTPSVVAFQPGGSSLVGRAAKQQDPRTTYYSVKRLIGRTWSDPAVQEERGRLAYEVDQDSEGNAVLVCPHVEPGCLYPEEVSTCVLAQLLADAARHTGRQVSKAVITVPAYFSDEQREATVAAGTLAGLDTVRLIREPVAAALAYGLDLTEEQVVLVFDLGGGTFDVSLLEVGNGTMEVLSTGGDAHLGGDDWDAAIVDWLRENFLDPAGVDSSSPAVAGRLKALAEYAKVQLSEHEQVTLRMPLGGPGGLQATLDQATFDSLSADLFRRARLPLDQACWAAGVDLNELQMGFAAKKEEMARKGVAKWKQNMLKLEIRPCARAAVSKVLLVGGATRMPAVRRFIANMTGLEPTGTDGGVDPDEAVALGAAVQAGILQGEVDSLMVMDQWQASLMRALAQLQLKNSPEARAAVAAKFDMDYSSEEGQAAEGQQQQQQQQPPGMLDAEHEDEMASEVLDGMREQQPEVVTAEAQQEGAASAQERQLQEARQQRSQHPHTLLQLKLEIRPCARAAVSKVLLVGGATRMPAVRRFIANMTGLEPTGTDGGVDPDEAVALGAAVQAGILQGEVDSLMVMDQWQASLMRALAQLQLKNSPEARAAVAAKFDMDYSSEEGQAAEGQQQQQQQQPPGMLDAEHEDEMASEVLDGMREQQPEVVTAEAQQEGAASAQERQLQEARQQRSQQQQQQQQQPGPDSQAKPSKQRRKR